MNKIPFAIAVSLVAVVASCSDSGNSGPIIDSNSNWLIQCDVDSDCLGDTACHCGICTTPCESDCAFLESELGPSQCVQGASGRLDGMCSAAADTPPGAVCLPTCASTDECGEGYECVSGACMLAGMTAETTDAGMSGGSDAGIVE